MNESVKLRCLLATGFVAALSGCFTAANTRLPLPTTGDPRAEAQGYRFHDPFPDVSAGPATYTRPPSYMKQRDPARRAAENRAFQGYNPGQVPATPLPPRSSYDYPDAVQTR